MGDLGVESADSALLHVLQTDHSPIVRAWAARSLGLLGAESAKPALIAAVAATNWQLRSAAAAALAVLGATDAKPVLVDATRRERNLLRKWRLSRTVKRL